MAAVLLLLLSNGCEEKKGNEQPSSPGTATKPATKHTYTLGIAGIADNIGAGAEFNVVVTAKQDGKEITGLAQELVVSLQIDCGARVHKEQQSADDKGVATFAAFTLDSSWDGACTATATAEVNGHDLTQKADFTIAEKLVLVAGREYVVGVLKDASGSIYNGFLSLGGCVGAKLLAITDDTNNPILEGDDYGLAINSGKNWRYIAVGVPDAGCKLMFASSAGGNTKEVGAVTATNTSDNIGYGKIRVHVSKQKVVVDTEKLSDANLYVYNHTNQVWERLDNINWGGEKQTNIKAAPEASENRALLAVMHNSKRWWYLAAAAITIDEVMVGAGGGRMFGINGVGTEAVAVQLENACGLEVYRFVKTSSNKAELKPITTTATELTPNREGRIGQVFAVGTLAANCQLSLKVAEVVVVADKTVAYNYPILMLEKQSGTNKLQLTSNSQGLCKPLYTSTSGYGGFRVARWKWNLQTRTTINKKWNSTVDQNQAFAIKAGNEVFYTRGK